ncbi:MAG: SH3 domain-containing protein [Clostridia bacterium]|nr:SH3 domain-containing protein [Clostridia bacterium]
MKRFAILFLVLALMLTACGESGITNTAHADETNGGDEYEDFNLEEGEIPDDAEPQIWYSEGVLYDDLDYLGYDTMVVANCNEWASLRAQPSTSSDRIAEVPLGAIVTNCTGATNGFIACDYAGQSGYILAEYLEPFFDDFDYDGIDAEEDVLPDTPINEEIDMSEVPAALVDGVIYVAHTTVGTIVIHDSAYIYRVVNNEITQIWDYYAQADNVIFDATEYYENPRYRWYGYVGNSLVHFTEDDMIVDVVNCTEFEYSGIFMYCYHNEAGVLYATSPCNTTSILGEVIEIYTKEGHTFVRRPDGTYLLTVPPYLISQMSQEYCNEHPIPYIYLGDGDWYGYYMELDTRNSGKTQTETTWAFDVKYGITSVMWGYPTTHFSPMSVELAAGKSYQEVYDYYNIAFERDGGGFFKVGDIDFADTMGILTYEFKNNMPSRVTWESYNANEEIFAEIQQYLTDDGYVCMGETHSGAGDKEYSYMIEGGFIMRVVYKDSIEEGTHVFIYVDY